MSGGNGVDIAAVYQLLTQVARAVNDHTRILNDHTQQLANLTRDVNDLNHGQATLRQTLTEYHSSVIGHGILIGNLEDRVRRIEQHLNLSPAQ
jgi:hypothetical protein